MLGAVLGGAFLGGLAESMKENREYVRQKSDAMQEYLWKAGLERQQEVKKARNALTRATDYLEDKGMNKNFILGILDEDAAQILPLYESAVEAEKTGILTPSLLNSAYEAAGTYKAPTGVTIADLIKKATPTFVEGIKLEKPDDKDKTVLQKIFSPATSEDILYQTYESDIMGVKGADVQASIAAPLIKEREAKSQITTDLGVFADQDFTSTEIKDLKEQIEDKYEAQFKAISDAAFFVRDDNNITATTDENKVISYPDGTERTVRDLRMMLDKITAIDNEDNPDAKIKLLMELDPTIAQSYLTSGRAIEQLVFTSPFGFRLNQDYIDNTLLPQTN